MANTNFVVHNGLSVGPTSIDAASGNITIPVGRHITIGNVLLRDNGLGRLAVRDITDNSDAIIDATVDAGSTTSGNVQIGTNHIESTNANGILSIRPNGTGNIVLAANTITIGKGGAFTLVSTGEQTDPLYGVNYTPSNIIVQTTGALSSGNVRVSMTTPSTSTATGAFQVIGGVGVLGSLYVGGGIGAGGTVGSAGQVLQSTGSGIQWAQADQIANSASNVRVTASYVNVSVNGSNIASFGAAGMMPTANASGSLGSTTVRWNNIVGVTGNFLSVNANYADLAEKYLADAEYEPGTVLCFGGEQEVTLCDVDMCPRVAGVVSTNPAYLMNSGLEGEHTVELALTGRVLTKVRGPISKGDLIVSAGEGHARAENIPQVGTVIGKALEDFDGDTGIIEVVVGKH